MLQVCPFGFILLHLCLLVGFSIQLPFVTILKVPVHHLANLYSFHIC